MLLSAYAFSSISLGPPLPVAPVTLDASGNLFGTTEGGGASGNGSVYEIAAGSTALTTLASFNGADGGAPVGGVTVDSSGDLFGTASDGGPSGDGTVYEIAHGSTTITALASFNGGDGELPEVEVTLDTSGDLFGTTYGGGVSNDGTVFEIAQGSTAVTSLASFSGSNGSHPESGVTIDSSGDLLGAAAFGGADGDGLVYEIPRGSDLLTTVASFNGSNGERPEGRLTVDSDGDLFGTTDAGGLNNQGTVYEIAAGSASLTTVASFNTRFSGYLIEPEGGVTVDADGDLFGTTDAGGINNEGTVYEIAAGSAAITTLASISGSGGSFDEEGVALDSGGDLFGATDAGGTNGYGAVYEIANGSKTFTTVASFNGSDEVLPEGGVTFDPSGDLFGTTNLGGAFNEGTVFEIAAGSAVTTLASFNGSDGSYPAAGVTFDSSGDMFGTTSDLGDSTGTVFEIAHGSTMITTLATFYGDVPDYCVTLDAGRNLFGTAGGDGGGIVFEIAHGTSTVTALASFNGSNVPSSGVSLDSSGDLFGATASDTDGAGTVFEIAHGTATVTTLASFSGSNGLYPSGVTLDTSGDLFGTTIDGGTDHEGTVFEIAQGSTSITALVNFNGSNGSGPASGVTLDCRGDLFGTTVEGGASGFGEVYEIACGSTAVTTLANFVGSDGISPQARAGVTLDAEGDLFGTTEYGGAASAGFARDGTVYELLLLPATSLSSSAVTTAYGSATTVTATLSSGNLPVAGETVAFQLSDNTPLGTAVTNSNGVATLTLTDILASGDYSFNASFAGDSSYGPSQSALQSLSVSQAATSTAVVSSNASPTCGQPVTFTATVAPASGSGETGTVQFQIDGTNAGSPVALSGDTAAYTTSTLAAGSHSIVAVYSGDSSFMGSTSPTFTQNVVAVPAPTVVSVTTNDGEADANTTQASEVRQLVVTFSQAVNLTQSGAFSLGVYNLDGTGGAVSGNGSNDGSITNISSVLNTATTTNGGVTWTITFAPSASNTDASASLIDGIYSFSINNADVMSNGVALTGSNTYTFHRLYGDVTGAGAVNNTDARDFSQAYGAAAGSANYNAAFDFGGAGANINNTDARDFSLRYGQTFSSVLPAGGIN